MNAIVGIVSGRFVRVCQSCHRITAAEVCPCLESELEASVDLAQLRRTWKLRTSARVVAAMLGIAGAP